MSRFKSSSLLTAMSIALLVAAGGERQARAQDVTTIRVDLTGLQLDSPRGRAEAERRIAQAADRIVGQPEIGDLRAMSQFDQVRDDIIRQADARLDHLVARQLAGQGDGLAGPAAVADGSKPSLASARTLSLAAARHLCGDGGSMAQGG